MEIDCGDIALNPRSPWSRTLLLELLVAIGCGFNLFVQPLVWDWSQAASLLLGVIDAQPALVAIWVALAPVQLTRRISIGLLVILLLAAALAIGIRWNATNGFSHRAVVHSIAFVALSFLQCALLAMVRRLFGWQLATSKGRSVQSPAKPQFTILAVFVWTLEVAAFSMLLHYLAKMSRDDDMPIFGSETLAWMATRSALIAGLTVPCLTLLWLLLASGRARWIGGLLTVVALVASAQLGYATSFGMSNRELMRETAMYSLGMMLCSLFVLGAFKALGFRLIRVPPCTA